jgi:hypothetical protein
MKPIVHFVMGTVAAVGALACDWSPPCPEGYRYDHEQRVCVDLDGVWDSGARRPTDSGPPPSDSGPPDDSGNGAGDGGKEKEIDAGG